MRGAPGRDVPRRGVGAHRRSRFDARIGVQLGMVVLMCAALGCTSILQRAGIRWLYRKAELPAELVPQPDPTSTPKPPQTAVPQMATEIAPAAAQPENTPTPSPIVAEGDNATGWASEVFRLINETRAQNGIAPYAYNALLEQAALLHAQDCQQRGSCNHTGSDGSNVRTRVARAGFGTAGAAECIVYSSSPSEAVAWWLDEVPPNDAHLRTLLSTWVTEIGIAVVPNGRGSFYFIADFGRPN